MVQQNARVPWGNDTGAAQIDVGEIGETLNQSARLDEPPIEDLEGPDESALEVEPALADEGVGEALGVGELGEDPEEGLVGEEEGAVNFGEIGG